MGVDLALHINSINYEQLNSEYIDVLTKFLHQYIQLALYENSFIDV